MTRAIFPGKFNPPHIGHVRTALKLARLYDLTVVVTSDVPEGSAFTPEEIAAEFKGLGLRVDVYGGTLTEADDNPYPGRLILTGNMAVVDWANGVGADCLFIPRSGKVSGTAIRS